MAAVRAALAAPRAMVKVSPTWVFMVVAFAALVVVHHSNTHVGLLDARERRHAEEVKRLRAMIDHAQRSADAGGDRSSCVRAADSASGSGR